jgi:hypothetical protein
MPEFIARLMLYNVVGFALLFAMIPAAPRIEKATTTFQYMFWVVLCYFSVSAAELALYAAARIGVSTSFPHTESQRIIFLLIQIPLLILYCMVLYRVLRRTGWVTSLTMDRKLPYRQKPLTMSLFGIIYIILWIARRLLTQPINDHWNHFIQLTTSRQLYLVLFLPIYAFIEEIVFRYWLVDMLHPRIRKLTAWPEIVTIVIAATLMSVVFSAVHFVTITDGGLHLFLVSMHFFLLRFFSGSIVFPIIAHYLGNVFILLGDPAYLTDYFAY